MTGTRHYGNGLDGLLIGDGARLNLAYENRILFYGRYGISLENADKNTIRKNTSNLNDGDGIRVDAFSTGNTLRENWMVCNEAHEAHDDFTGFGTADKANNWLFNAGSTENLVGLLWLSPCCT